MAADPSFMLEHSFRVVGCVDGCAMCGSPCHPATDSVVGGRRVCGACVRSLLQGLRECAHPARRSSGVPFYAHATPPPPATCE
jgi:recombinational DNA repair protein (RecF pathway)